MLYKTDAPGGGTNISIYFGDLELAHKVVPGSKRKQFVYVKEGSCEKVTCWFRWYGVKTDGANDDGKHIPVDVHDDTQRYTAAQVVDYTAAAPVYVKGNDLRPIIRGVTLEPCNVDSCCGSCFKLADNDREALKGSIGLYV